MKNARLRARRLKMAIDALGSAARRFAEGAPCRRFMLSALAAVLALTTVLSAPATALAADAGSSQPASSELKTLRIGFPSAGGNWPEGILGDAYVKGYLDEYLKPLGYKAQVQGFTGAAPALHEALVGNSLDLVDYAGFAGILGKSKGIDTTLLAITSYSSGWRLVASASSGITSPKDLKGKKVVYMRGATPQMYLIKVLKDAGLEFGDIEAVNGDLQDGLTAVATGAADAAVVSAGQEQQLVDEGKVVVLHKGASADQATYYEPNSLVARTQFAKDNPEVMVAVLKAYLKAQADMRADPEAFFQLSAKESGLSVDVVKSSAAKNPADNWPVSLSKDLVTSLSKVEEFELSNKIIASEVDIASWADPSYLKRALTEYGSDGKGTDGAKLAAEGTAGIAGDSGSAAAAQSTGSAAGLISAGNLAAVAVAISVTAAVAIFRSRTRKLEGGARARKTADILFSLILPVWVVLAWHLATSSGLLSTVVLPTISSVGRELVEQLTTGTFKGDLAISVSRILKGYALAAVLGVFFGVVMGMSLSANRFFSLTFQAIRQIPMMAWVPLLVIWFGIGEESKVAVIFLASFFPILINTIDGIQRTDAHLVEVGRMYRLNPWRLFREIYLPSALPSIFVGLRLALGISWMAVVGAEMIAASSGIGFRINDDRVLMNYASVFAGMIVIAVAGVLMDAVLNLIARACTPWRDIKQQ